MMVREVIITALLYTIAGILVGIGIVAGFL